MIHKKKCPQCGDMFLFDGYEKCERCDESRDEPEMVSVTLTYLSYLQDRVRQLEAVLKGVPG